MPEETNLQSGLKPAATKLAEDDTLSSLQMAPAGNDHATAERRLLVFRKIAAPLMAVVAGSSDGNPESASKSAEQFVELIDTTIALNQHILHMLDVDGVTDSDARWHAASASSEIVAQHYRATSHALTKDEASAIATTLSEATTAGLADLDLPDKEPREQDSKLGHNLKALAPVASSIARFSFGRDPMELLGEVARRLTQIAAEVAGKLGGPDESEVDSALYYAVLEVAGEFYMESHFTEMDRLLEMAPEERKEYVQSHNRRIPMEPVWERLALKMGMLEALTAYLPGVK